MKKDDEGSRAERVRDTKLRCFGGSGGSSDYNYLATSSALRTHNFDDLTPPTAGHWDAAHLGTSETMNSVVSKQSGYVRYAIFDEPLPVQSVDITVTCLSRTKPAMCLKGPAHFCPR